MRNAARAIVVSLAAHLALALALGGLLLTERGARLPRLDLSSVELQLEGEETANGASERETARARNQPVSESRAVRAPAPHGLDAPPAICAPPGRTADPATPLRPTLTEPSEEGVKMVTPPAARIEAPPSLRQAIRPRYPKASRQRGEEGNVTLALRVTADGTVADAAVVKSSGYPALDAAALEAVKAAAFSPATANGRPIASSARLTLRFSLK